MDDTAPLVVAIDGSPESASALACALRLATALDRPVTPVHAAGLLEEGGFRPAPLIDDIVATAERGVPGAGGVAVTIVHDVGPAVDVILRVADRVGADMIVVGRRGLGAAPRPLGSVSEELLARAHLPVLVVPHS